MGYARTQYLVLLKGIRLWSEPFSHHLGCTVIYLHFLKQERDSVILDSGILRLPLPLVAGMGATEPDNSTSMTAMAKAVNLFANASFTLQFLVANLGKLLVFRAYAACSLSCFVSFAMLSLNALRLISSSFFIRYRAARPTVVTVVGTSVDATAGERDRLAQ